MGLFDHVFSKEGSDDELEPVSSAQDQPNDEKELVAYIRKKVEECRSSGSRITHEGIWMTNIAYLLGFDSVFYDTTTRQFKVVGRANQYLRRNRIHVNKILPTVQNRLARLCKNPPRYDVRPKTAEPEDKEASELSLKIINMIWDLQKVNKKRLELTMWAQQCGHSYLKVSFDDQLGKPMVDPMTQELSYEGDIRVDVVSPFEIFPDPLAKTMEDAQWIVQAKVRKLDYFKTHYDRGPLVKEENAWLLSAQYEARINQLNNQGPTTSGTQNALKNAAIELSYYEKRSKKHPNGRHIVAANGVLLEDKELPVGEIPFVKFDDILVAGKFYSESIITHLRPIQDQYNRTISKRADWTNRLLAGKYIAAKGHGLIQEAMNDQSGEVVEYDPVPNAMAPTALPVPNIPAYAYQEEDRLNGMMLDISGINEASRGQLPSASIPAAGMQLLIEQDDTRIGVITEGHEEGFAVVGKLILLHAEKFYEMKRLLKFAGKTGEYCVREFVGADIQGNNDVIVIRGSTLPGSKTLKRQEILNLYNQGLLGQPGDPKVVDKVLGVLEYGEVAEVWKKYHLQTQLVKHSIDQLEQGILPEVKEFDPNPFLFQEINDYRLEKLPEGDLKLLALTETYLEGLLQEITQLQNPGMPRPGTFPRPPMTPLTGGMPGQPPGAGMPGEPPPGGAPQ